MTQVYEEWEITGQRSSGRKWDISDNSLPASSREAAQALADSWADMSPEITYEVVGWNVERTLITEL